MKDASVGRGLSSERLGMSKNSQTSFAEPIPVPQATLPIAILERPSLEDSAVSPKQVTLQVEECDPPEDDANRSYSARARNNFRPHKNENLTRSAARLRLGIINNGSNSSSMVSFKNRTRDF